MVFPPSRPPAWLSQSLADGGLADGGLADGGLADGSLAGGSLAIEESVAPPQGVAPLLSVVEVPTAAKLEDSGDTGRDGRMRVPTGAGVS